MSRGLVGTSSIYVPILKGREGEFAALQELYSDVRGKILPLIEVPQIPRDYAKGGSAKELDDHIAPIADRLRRCWLSGDIYLDMSRIGLETLRDGRLALELVLNECATFGVNAIPVLSLSSSGGYVSTAGAYSAASGLGTCLRLVVRDFREEVDLEAETSRIFDALQSKVARFTDLIIDLEDLGSDLSRATLIARSVFSMVPRKDEWRRMVVCAASFPEDLSDVDAAATTVLPRHEWLLWKTLQRKPNALPRPDLIFGDYAVAHPMIKDLDPRTMRMSANIRYTTPDDWLVLKGRNVRQYGFDQYFGLCEELIKMPQYLGRAYSWGDKYIDDCAEHMAGPGNATTWRKVGVNHHLTLVTRELANLRSDV